MKKQKMVIINNNITKYLKLKTKGFKTLWTGNNLICLIKTL